MIKVLLVDDERYMIEMLKEIIDWEFYGFSIVGTAENARDGMNLFYREQPDIIITDICLDQISGIEFITRIRLINASVKIMILSAYDKFEYAQKAVKLDVDGYLLKPVNREELLNSLLELQKKLESGSRYQEEIRDLRHSLDSLQRKYVEEQLIRIYEHGGETAKKELEEDSYWAVASIRAIVRNEIVFLEQDMKSYDDLEIFLLFVGDGLFALFLCGDRGNRKSVRKALEQIRQKYCERDRTLLCGVSTVEEAGSLPEACRASKSFLNMLFYTEDGTYLSHGIMRGVREMARGTAINQEQILLWLAAQETERLREMLRRWLDTCAKDNVDRVETIQNFLQCIFTMKTYVQGSPKEKQLEKLMEEQKQIVRSCQLEDIFERCLGELDEEELHRNKSALLIANAQNLIRNNCFDETFSIEVLADSLNISKSYLSKLYKEETGESVWNYVIRVRIARAKELLIHTDDTNYAIAKAIGYSSEYHFSRAFSKIVGVSPSAYKKLYMEIQ